MTCAIPRKQASANQCTVDDLHRSFHQFIGRPREMLAIDPSSLPQLNTRWGMAQPREAFVWPWTNSGWCAGSEIRCILAAASSSGFPNQSTLEL
jgi:hypothetical protein